MTYTYASTIVTEKTATAEQSESAITTPTHSDSPSPDSLANHLFASCASPVASHLLTLDATGALPVLTGTTPLDPMSGVVRQQPPGPPPVMTASLQWYWQLGWAGYPAVEVECWSHLMDSLFGHWSQWPLPLTQLEGNTYVQHCVRGCGGRCGPAPPPHRDPAASSGAQLGQQTRAT